MPVVVTGIASWWPGALDEVVPIWALYTGSSLTFPAPTLHTNSVASPTWCLQHRGATKADPSPQCLSLKDDSGTRVCTHNAFLRTSLTQGDSSLFSSIPKLVSNTQIQECAGLRWETRKCHQSHLRYHFINAPMGSEGNVSSKINKEYM